MIDVFYDQRVKLICSAEAQPEWLVVDGRLEGNEKDKAAASTKGKSGGDASLMVSAEFGRTASRLREMQSKEYFSRAHASAADPRVLERS
mgnify:FL=1